MTKIINNQCDKQGNVYITLSDILGERIHYNNEGKFKYIQDTSGNKYENLQNMKMDSNIRLTDPRSQDNILIGKYSQKCRSQSKPRGQKLCNAKPRRYIR